MATKWQTAKDTAARVTVDLVLEVAAKCSKSSKTRDLNAIEPVLGVRALPLWFRNWPSDRESSLGPGTDFVNSVALSNRPTRAQAQATNHFALRPRLSSRECIDSAA